MSRVLRKVLELSLVTRACIEGVVCWAWPARLPSWVLLRAVRAAGQARHWRSPPAGTPARPGSSSSNSRSSRPPADGGGGSPGVTGVRPVMPPPAFPSQPWQGSRLGPLPPLQFYPSWPRRKVLKGASALTRHSTAGQLQVCVGRAALAAPARWVQRLLARGGKPVPAILESACAGQLQRGGAHQRGHARQAAGGEQPSAKRARRSPLPEQAPPAAAGGSPIAEGVRARVGEAGFLRIRDTLLAQQATLQQQVRA